MKMEFVTETDVASRIGISSQTLRRWRLNRAEAGPPFMRVAGRIRYRAADVDAWLAQTLDDPRRLERRHASGRPTALDRAARAAAASA
jgi:predicted DNA-binding transcriptional regulator AlpA